MDEEFEEWKAWFDSHKEPDGSIDLSKHNDLTDYLKKMYMPPSIKFKDLPDNLGETINFDFSSMRVVK